MPVHDELQKGLMTWGEEQQQRIRETQERIKHGPLSAPIRECIIDGVKTFDNRGTLCPDEDGEH